MAERDAGTRECQVYLTSQPSALSRYCDTAAGSWDGGGVLKRQDKTQNAKDEQIVERLYDVALDPTSYEGLVDAWEAKLAGMGTGPQARFMAHQLEGHVRRASAFLDRLDHAVPTPIAEILNQHAPFSALALGGDMQVIATNFQDDTALPARLCDIDFLSAQAAQDVARLARDVFRSGQDVIQALSDTQNPGTGIALVKLGLARSNADQKTVVAVFSRVRWTAQVAHRLQSAFGLSKTEVQIVRLVLQMKGRTEIARHRNRSPETIKRHFSSIFQKTGCRSSGELLLLLMSFINLISDAAPDSTSEPEGLRRTPSPLVSTPSPARSAYYVAAGAVHGRTCIHLPGPYCLSQWPASAERAATARGMRVLTPIRAGYGPVPALGAGVDLASDVVSDVVRIMDAYGIARAPLVTQGRDIVFAFRFARKHPDRVSAIIACGGTLLFNRPNYYDHMDKWHRFIMGNARYAPRVLPFIVKAGFLLAQRIGKQRFLEQVYAKAPGDLRVFADPECLAAILEGSRFALSDVYSAHRGFAQTISYFVRNAWLSDVTLVADRVPVHIISGAQDPMVSPGLLPENARSYPQIDLKIHDDAGEFLFFHHWPEVLDLIERYL